MRWKQVKERIIGAWDPEDVCRQRKEESQVGRGQLKLVYVIMGVG